MFHCIIIEDEPLAAEKLKGYIEKIPGLKLLETFNSAMAALGFLKANQVDLIFLDIEMKEFTGIDLLESINLNTKVIITTAYETYAIKGFELRVADYLLKPISFERFLKACDRVINDLASDTNEREHKRIFVKTEYRLEGIDTIDIFFIEGMGDYRKIVTKEKIVLTLQTFKELTNLLPAEKFCRVHNSHLVSLDKIEKIERRRIVINNEWIPISESYSKEFFRKINI